MSCTAKSLYGWKVTLVRAAVEDLPLVSERVWQAEHPIFVNTCCPRATVDVVADVEDDVAAVEVVPAAAGKTLLAEATTVLVLLVLVLLGAAAAATAGVAPAGVGGASKRMKAANRTASDWKPAAGLVAAKSLGTTGVGLSGSALVAQPVFSSRSCGNSSLVTPISTL